MVVPAVIMLPTGKLGAGRMTAGRRPGRMPGPSAREGEPAIGTTSAERARAPAARVAEGYRPWRRSPASCRNEGTGGQTCDQDLGVD
jgi:hypothetical protein